MVSLAISLCVGLLLEIISSSFLVKIVAGQAPDEKRLRDYLSQKYTWLVRPVAKDSDRLDVKLRFKLKRIVELSLKDQILTTHIEIEHEWLDYKMKWNPDKYGGITSLVLPAEQIWCPDTYFWNSFGEPSMKSKLSNAVIHSDGRVNWSPSLIFQCFCPIKVRYYPFDIQTCNMTFGSWTYDGFKLQMTLMDLTAENNSSLSVGMSLVEYSPSAEWDLLAVSADNDLKYYVCCPEPYYTIVFNITLRRHTLVYLVNLVAPLILISYLSLFVFYLPTDSGEKITLCMSILMSQIMFLLLLMDSIPVTSLEVPLLGRLIVFNISLVFFSILSTTLVLRIHYRKPTTGHRMARWVNNVRVNKWLRRLLLMENITSRTSNKSDELSSAKVGTACNCRWTKDSLHMSRKIQQEHDTEQFLEREEPEMYTMKSENEKAETACDSQQKTQGSSKKNVLFSSSCMQNAVCAVSYVAAATERKSWIELECDEWKSLASLLDRILLIIFHLAFYVGNVIILKDAPALIDGTEPLNRRTH